jgi:sterol desaturase/sphingolipid hydroxylase (fatty acid hydroxylase superfamily)
MSAFVLGWAVFVAWSLATFTALERVWPRRRYRVPVTRIAAAAALMLGASLVARALATAPVAAPVVRVAAAWLVTELLHYALHRAMHRVPLLWRFHRMHHDGAPLAWTTAWYLHPVDSALFAAAAVVAGVVTGAGVPAALWFVVGRRAWTVVLHANIAWPASRLDAVIATPPFHARHHREDLPAANFASTLPVLDRLFGTAR